MVHRVLAAFEKHTEKWRTQKQKKKMKTCLVGLVVVLFEVYCTAIKAGGCFFTKYNWISASQNFPIITWYYRSHRLEFSHYSSLPRFRLHAGKAKEIMGVFHLPRDSENSGWVVNGTWFFGLFHWKISGKSGTSEKVVPFSRWKFFDGTACSIYGFRKGLPVPGHTRPYLRQGNMAATPSASSVASISSAFYECSVCHGLSPDLGT